MDGLQGFLDKIGGIIWGPPLLILLVGTGIFLTVRLGFIQVRLLPYSLKQVFSENQDKKSEGDISHFQALMTAMAATVGVGNIVGVATAVVLRWTRCNLLDVDGWILRDGNKIRRSYSCR